MGVTGVVVGCAFGIGVGLVMFVRALGGQRAPGAGRRSSAVTAARPVRSSAWWLRRIGAPVAVAVLIGIVTRWPVAGLLAGLAAFGLPNLLGQTASSRSTAKVEAIASWTELLRDTLAAAAGLSQAIIATAEIAPGPIHAPVAALSERVMNGTPLEQALRQFASEVDDASADLVVAALLLAASARAQRLVDLLSALADSIRQDVAMRLRVESGRAAARSGVRTIVVFSLVFAGLLTLVARSYLAPFGSATGQVVLAVVGALYAAGLVLMVRLIRPPTPVRLLGNEPA